MIHGVLLDLEGVLYTGGYPLPGSRESLLSLRAAGIPLRFITNTTRQTRAILIDRLAAMGLPVALQQLFTPVVAARDYLIHHQLTPYLLVHPAIQSEFADLVGSGSKPGAVLLGDAGPGFSYEALNRCFRLLLDGLPLLTMGSSRHVREGGGWNLAIGPFMAALEYAAQLEAVVLGKPSAEFFQAAAHSLELPAQDVVMVGDDAEMDVCGALAAGLRGVLVRTGQYHPGDEAKVEPRGGRVFDDLDAVVDYIL